MHHLHLTVRYSFYTFLSVFSSFLLGIAGDWHCAPLPMMGELEDFGLEELGARSQDSQWLDITIFDLKGSNIAIYYSSEKV